MAVEIISRDQDGKPSKEDVTISQTDKKPSRSFMKKYPVLFTVFCGLLAIGILYIWKEIQLKRERVEITEKAEKKLAENNIAMLKLMTKPLIWSIRGEMQRGNMEQVNIFTSDMVKEKNIQLILLIDTGGKIMLSTDKKLEGKEAADFFDKEYINADSILIKPDKNGDLLITAPVMGYDKKLATIIMNYKMEKLNLLKQPD